ncbi:hypothetical protein LLEC1_00523 [Akanthomyces lecanii]|uniref:Uncharacterized protein n=1 Tax=Cordyceps confragosa TaxID=2714763 RepID=A0A179I8L3_CORDF|nr:hypothetical protein LLEC1_00523 [Akanthomyces lecanii]
MSAEPGAVSIANKGKASVWTEEAKYELLLRIIHQLKKERSINWAAIKMKNRNTKSLTNQWTRIGKDIAALEDLDVDADGANPTPKKGSAAKRKAAPKNEDGDQAPETPVKKRARPAAFQFLLRVIAQLQRSGQSIKWDEIDMPGRTPKSLQHIWAKIKTQVAELEKASGQQPSTPTKAKGKGAGTKRKAEATLTPEATPQKKRTQLPEALPAKKEESDEDD